MLITEKLKPEIDAIMRKYPNKRSAVMDLLRIAQREGNGTITKPDMDEIAAFLEMQPVEVNAAAAFYTMYVIDKPMGRHHLQVCRNISCSLLGAEHIVSHLERKLGIKTGNTTPDGKFTISTVECLGSCGTAPMMMINDDYHENLTLAKIDELLAKLD